METNELDDWKTKAEAAEILQCSEKSIERLASQKKVEKRQRRIPGRRPLPVFNAEDIERIRQETMSPEAFPLPQGQTKALAKRSAGNFAEVFARLVANADNGKISPTQKVYLSLNEAVEYSGLPRAWLLRKIKSGGLDAIKAAGWKIRRTELEAL